jgi:hypothetical protein
MFPNARVEGLAATTAAVPNPESATFCGLLLAESVIVRVAVRVPVADGLKRIATVQPALAARVDPQVLLEIMKSAAFVPVKAMPRIEIEAEPPFVNVTDFGAPTLPSETLAQLRLDGLTVAAARHFDPEMRLGARSIPNISDLRIFGFLVEALTEEAAGAANCCLIRRFMGVSFLRKNER